MLTLSLRLILTLALLSGSTITHAQPKVWELDDTVRSQVGDVHLSMQKNFASNAPIGDFWANAVNTQSGINAIFRGACAEVIEVAVTATDIRKIDLTNFTASRSGSDLPIGDVMSILQDGLVGQCEQLEVMRISFNASYTSEDYSYQGTATRSDGWRLQDGLIATEHDNGFVFEINLRDMLSVAGVYYKGGCEQSPRMVLEPRYANNSERALSDLPDMPAYHMTAQSASAAYRAQCPGTEQIEFALNPIPDEYICAEEGECFLNSYFESEWVIDNTQFAIKRYNNPITNAHDVVEVLAAGRFDILPNYDSFLRFYTEVWFGAYSDQCRIGISEPVLRQTQVVEREYDEFGGLVDEDFGPVRDIWIESSQASVYDSVFQTWKGWAVARMLMQMAEGNIGGRNPFDTVSSSMGFFTNTIDEIEDTVRGNCTDARILTARDNMIRYFRSEPAITDRYTTDKEPQNSYPENISSAPFFTQAVLDARVAEQEEIQSFRQQEQAADNAERQARIQTDIAARTPGYQAAAAQSQGGLPITPEQSASPQNAAQVTVSQQQASQNLQTSLASLEEIAQDHAARLGEIYNAFQENIQATTDPAERIKLQQEFQQTQAEMQQEYQRRVLELATQ